MRELSAAACRQGELFGPGAADWAEHQERVFGPLWEAALDGVCIAPEGQLLDAGCGAGGAAMLAAQRGAVVHGVDPSVNMLTFARERMPTADFRIGEIENLPFSNAQFDAAIAVNSLPFASSMQLGVHELTRVCRRGGRIAVIVPAESSRTDMSTVYKAYRGLMPAYAAAEAGLFAASTPGALESLFQSVEGLRLENIREIEAPAEYGNIDKAVRANLAGSDAQRAIELRGRPPAAEAIHQVLMKFEQPGGEILLHNRFRCAIGVATA